MKIKTAWHVLLAVMLCGAGEGCAKLRFRTQTDKELTGLFDNSRERLLESAKKIKIRETKFENLNAFGFDNLTNVNIQQLEGFTALNSLFRQEFRDFDPARLDALIAKSSGYRLFRIPCKNVFTKEHRFYFSKKNRWRSGYETEVRILFYDSTVVYVEVNDLVIETDQKTRAFARGLTELLGEFGGAVGGAAGALK